MAWLVLPQCVLGQTRVEILTADTLSGEETELGQIRKMVGNVELRTQDLHVLADSAYQYLEVELIEAFGNIQIKSERQIIWADRVRYNTATDESHFFGRVVIKTDNATIFSTEARYDFFLEIARFPKPVRFQDEKGDLLADGGIFNNITDRASFWGNVQVADSTQYAEADSLFSIRNEDYYELHRRVFVHDIKNRSKLTGDFTKSDQTGYREILGDARVQRISKSESDTTMISANRFEIFDSDTVSVVYGYGDVEIWSDRYAAIADSSKYDDMLENFLLTGNTRLWRKDMQLTSPQTDIQIEGDEIESLKAWPRPFIVLPDSATGRFNQITGDSLWMWFDAGDISLMESRPAAEMIYHAMDENDEPEFAIQLRARHIGIYFSGGDIDSLRILENIDGTYIANEREAEQARLQGFVYESDLRPQRPVQWLEPRLPPIDEELPFTLPRRYREYLARQKSE